MKLGIVADRPFSYTYILSYKSVSPHDYCVFWNCASIKFHIKSHNFMSFGRRNRRRFDIKKQSPTILICLWYAFKILQIRTHLTAINSKLAYYKNSVSNFLKRKNRNAIFMFWVWIRCSGHLNSVTDIRCIDTIKKDNGTP